MLRALAAAAVVLVVAPLGVAGVLLYLATVHYDDLPRLRVGE
jgi:hypothetical protein